MSSFRNPNAPINLKLLLRNFVVEFVVYSTFVVIYFLLVLRFLDGYLAKLFTNNLTKYAFIGLTMILLQGVLLDAVTSFLLNQIKLDRFD